MKPLYALLFFTLALSKAGNAQTLQTVVDNGNTTTSPVRIFGHADFGEAWDPTPYGAVQITRPANLDPKFHLSFIRNGQMVYGMGYLYNSSVFAIQAGSDNKSLRGLFMDANGYVGIGNTTPGANLDVKGQIAVSGTGAGVNFLDRNDNSKVLQFFNTGGNLNLYSVGYGMTDSKITFTADGRIGIGTLTPKEALSVNGNIRAREIKVETQYWPDYVFSKSYLLPDLKSVEKHIERNGHLPGIPSAEEAEKEGINVSEMNAKLLKKIEELTLYLIKQDKELKKIKIDNQKLKKAVFKRSS